MKSCVSSTAEYDISYLKIVNALYVFFLGAVKQYVTQKETNEILTI